MFEVDVLISEDFTIKQDGVKKIYNTDGKVSLTEWGKAPLKGIKVVDVIQMSSALKPGYSNKVRITIDALSYLDVKANNVDSNSSNVGLYSVARSNRGGFSLNDKNFLRGCIIFFARKSINSDWKIGKNEYLSPNEEHADFEQFQNNSLVYSLFNPASNQSSLRQVTYKDKLWDIKNEFFWMSVEEMKQLADDNGYDNLYNDARTSPNRHVYNLLFGEERIYDKLSPDAKLVLDKASELVRKSVQARQLMSDNENHLDSWDAGYAQLKLVWKEYFSEDFKEFRQMYKNLEDRMRPLVYELGFLMK